jgi:predicted AAA+ superfamily ATPase
MKRLIQTEFDRWHASQNRKPLIIRGARQVGKTYSVVEFGKASFETFQLFDFEKDRSLHRIFEGDLTPAQLLLELEAHCNCRIIPGKSLVFFDEIQACPRAILSLRYFYETLPELHLIAAGSLLEFALSEISFPVGRVEFLWMRPMLFEEFLLATKKEVLQNALPSLQDRHPVPESIHRKLLEQLQLYFAIGGMPEAVRIYTETGSLTETARVHESLTQAYLQDFSKYSGRMDPEIIQHVYRQLPAWIGRQTQYAKLYPEKRTDQIKKALHILEQTLITHRISSSPAQGLPLGAGASDRLFKYLFLDIGLLRHLSGLSVAHILQETELLDIFRGSLAEQFIGQELLARRSGSENERLFYWCREKPNSSAEVDFLMTEEGRILPVEVKSGPAGKLRSLHLFLAEHPQTPYGIVLNSGNIKQFEKERLHFFPLYTRLK